MIRRQIAVSEAAIWLNLSERQVRRVLARYRERGPLGLAHGNRGRRPRHALSDELRNKILTAATSVYAGCNARQISEQLRRDENLTVSRASIHRILAAAGSVPGEQDRPGASQERRIHQQEGMLLWIAAVNRRWLRQREEASTLLVAVDDATGGIAAALFRAHEDVEGYFSLVRRVIETRGRPLAVSLLGALTPAPSQRPAAAHQVAEAGRDAGQLGRLLQELAIVVVDGGIAAGARRGARGQSGIGREEGEARIASVTAPLLTALHLAGATNLAQANAVLAKFAPLFNAKIAAKPTIAALAYRSLPSDVDLDGTFSLKYARTVTTDNTVWLPDRCLQLLPSNGRVNFTRARVEIRQGLDGAVSVYFQGDRIPVRERSLLRARHGRLTVTDRTADAAGHSLR